MRQLAKNTLYKLRTAIFGNRHPKEIIVKLDKGSNVDTDEITRRVHYFAPSIDVRFVEEVPFKKYLDTSLVSLNSTEHKKSNLLKIKREEVYDLNYLTNYMDGWDYHRMLTRINRDDVSKAVERGKEKIKQLQSQLSARYSKAYILGTGPSLERAGERDWSDGIRIVSNTIVKDPELWNFIQPHFIVAGDAIYHYGPSKFAKSFRADLKKRLAETDTYFVFPSIFYAFCKKEFGPEFEDRLIPVPMGKKTTVHHNLAQEYVLPGLGNVLPLLLLPVACTFSHDINLWGFDGRSPNDKMFWKNSDRHFYNEHIDELKSMHPAFFDVLVPKGKQDQYVKSVHGEPLEVALSAAEKDGFKFTMLHFSHTEVLQKRSAK